MPAIKDERGNVVVPEKPSSRPPAPIPAPVVQHPNPDQRGAATQMAAPPVGQGASLPDTLTGPPVRVLQQAKGWHGSIADFNDRAQQANDAYQKAYGVKPPPNLILDLAASPVSAEHFPTMFTVPTNPVAAKLKGTLATHPAKSAQQLASEMQQAAGRGEYATFVADNSDLIHGYASDPKASALLYRAMDAAQRINAWHTTTAQPKSAQAAAEQRMPADYGNPNNLVAPADRDTYRQGMSLSFGHLLGTAVGQVAQSLIDSPLGIYQAGKAIGLDASDATAAALSKALPGGGTAYERQHGNLSFSRTRKIGKATAETTVEDVKHPTERPGYLFLDALGLASMGAGTLERGAAAGRAVAEEGSVAARAGSAVKALARKPAPKTATLTRGDLSVDVLLSDNPFVAAVQRKLVEQRQQGLTPRVEPGEAVPTAAAGVIGERMAQGVADWVAEQTSTETKLGRELRAQRRAEVAIRNSVLDPMLKAAGWSMNSAASFDRLPATVRRGLSRGEQKAIQVASFDDPTPLDTMRGFHQQMIDAGIGDAEAHRRQLADLKMAEKALKQPSKRLQTALAAVSDVMAEQQQLKIDQLGLTPETAESSIARRGAVLRGEDVTEPAHLADPEIQQKIDDTRDRLAENLSAQEEFASKPRSAERAAGGPATGRSPDATLARLRREESDLRTQLDELQGRTTLKQLERVNPDSFYLPIKSEAHSPRVADVNTGKAATIGQYGIAKPSQLSELNHVFTGQSLQIGDYRIDATGLAHETYAKTVKAVSILNDYKRLLKASTDTKQSRFDVPIREERGIPEPLKQLLNKIDAGAFTSEDAAAIPDDELAALHAHLYPSPETEQLDGVRWVDRRIIGDANRLPRRPGRVMKAYEAAVNTPLRAAALYLKPSYAINLLGNAGMGVIQQGFAFPANVLRAAHATDLYGERTTAMLDAMAGESRSRSYAAGDTSPTEKLSHALGSFWNAATDRTLRRAAVIYELRRIGYRTPDEIRAVTAKALRDDKTMGHMTQASRRAKKAMVELDNLTSFEQEVLRHLVFVYPWVSRSAVWSLRTIAEHPVKTRVLAALGDEAERSTPELQHLEKWMRETGYFPIGSDPHGDPKLVNPGSINTFSTLGEIAGLVDGSQTLDSTLGPGATLGLHWIEGKDRFGRPYKNRVVGPLIDSVAGLPQYAAVTRLTTQPKPVTPPDVTDRNSLVQQEHQEAKQPVFVNDGLWAVIGPLLAGGLAPRVGNQKSIDARYWAAQPAEARRLHDGQLMQQALTVQGDLLDRGVPSKVRQAVRVSNALQAVHDDFAKTHGRYPTVRERAGMLIDWLASHLQITGETADKLRGDLGNVRDDRVSAYLSMVGRKYADGAAYSDWHKDVKTVASFQSQLLDEVIAQGIGRNVIDGSYRNAAGADEKTLRDLGRRYVAYQHAIAKFRDEAKNSKQAPVVNAELRQYIDEHDQPVKLNGHTFPSLPRLAVAFMPADQMNAHLTGLLDAPWQNLSGLDKQMLGFGSVKPGVAQAWAAYKHATAPSELAKQLPAGGRDLDSYQRRAVARQIDRAYHLGGSFIKDYDFAQQPLFERLQHLNAVQHSKNRGDWQAVFQQAATLTRAVRDGSITQTEADDAWKDYAPKLEEFVKTSRPEFWAELQPILKQNPNLISNLIN